MSEVNHHHHQKFQEHWLKPFVLSDGTQQTTVTQTFMWWLETETSTVSDALHADVEVVQKCICRS